MFIFWERNFAVFKLNELWRQLQDREDANRCATLVNLRGLSQKQEYYAVWKIWSFVELKLSAGNVWNIGI